MALVAAEVERLRIWLAAPGKENRTLSVNTQAALLAGLTAAGVGVNECELIELGPHFELPGRILVPWRWSLTGLESRAREQGRTTQHVHRFRCSSILCRCMIEAPSSRRIHFF